MWWLPMHSRGKRDQESWSCLLWGNLDPNSTNHPAQDVPVTQSLLRLPSVAFEIVASAVAIRDWCSFKRNVFWWRVRVKAIVKPENMHDIEYYETFEAWSSSMTCFTFLHQEESVLPDHRVSPFSLAKRKVIKEIEAFFMYGLSQSALTSAVHSWHSQLYVLLFLALLHRRMLLEQKLGHHFLSASFRGKS